MATTPAKKKEAETAFYQKASPTLLAQQPNDPKGKPKSVFNSKQWNALRSHLEADLISLRNWRQSWWSQNWSNLAEYILPRRSIWLTQSTGGTPTPNNMNRGRMLNSAIKDSTATYAVRVCSAGLMSGLASPSRPWFKMIPLNKSVPIDDDGKLWLDEVEDRIYTVLANSNFYNSFAQECEDLVVYGTAPSIIYEDDKDLIRCYNPANGEYYLSSDATMRVDGLDRQFVMTVKQIVSFFGLDNCPPDIQSLWKQKGSSLEMERIVAHVIEPNFEVDGCPSIPGNFTWREVYWLYGSGSDYPLSVRGFVDKPFSAARWATQSNDAYGRSPGMDVLPDVIQLQVMTVRLAEAIEKQVRPPLVADMSMKNQPSSTLPGHITYAQNLSAGTGIRSVYTVNPDIGGMEKLIEQVEARIKVGLFNDIILMLSSNPGDRRTAYETAQLVQERLQVLGPVIEGLLDESLKPKLKRIYNILTRKGMLPPMPNSIKKAGIDVNFISMLALAQKASSTAGLERLAALIGNLASVYPQAKNRLNVDAYIREMNTLLDNPEQVLNSEKTAQAMDAADQKAQQQAQQMQAAEHTANTVNTGAKAAQVLSNTNVGAGQSVLASMFAQ